MREHLFVIPAEMFRRSKVNRVVQVMIYGDFLLITGSGFVSPIVAVFLTTQIEGGSLAVVGFATTLFWIVKSVVQIPVASYTDKTEGERDDFQLMILGATLAAIVPLLYFFFAREAWHIYLFETINGVAYALQVPTYLAIFTRHIDKHQESTEWMLHSNAVGLGFAAAAAIGGVLAERFGFRAIFLLVSAVMFLGVVTLLMMRDELDGDHDGRMMGSLSDVRAKGLVRH